MALRRTRIRRPTFVLVIVGLAVVDLTAFGSGYNPRVPRAVVEARPAVADVVTAESGLYRTTVLDRVQSPLLDKSLLSSSMGLLYGTRDVVLLSPLVLPRQDVLLGAAGLDVGMEPGSEKVTQFLANLGVAELMGIRFVVTTHELEHPRIEPVWQGDGVRVFRLPEAQPRAFVVGCAESVAGPDEGIARLLAIDTAARATVEAATPFPCKQVTGSAEIRVYEAQRVEIRAELDGPGLLVLTDTWYPGWEATVDGETVDILRTDVSFRGIVLEPGVHEVVFRYAPAWGPLVPLSCGLMLVLLLGLPFAWQKQRGDASGREQPIEGGGQ